MRNYKNKNRIVSKKLIIAGIIIATQAIIFSGGKKLDKNFNVNVASAEVPAPDLNLPGVSEYVVEFPSATFNEMGDQNHNVRFTINKDSCLEGDTDYIDNKIREISRHINLVQERFNAHLETDNGFIQAKRNLKAAITAYNNVIQDPNSNQGQIDQAQQIYDNAKTAFNNAKQAAGANIEQPVILEAIKRSKDYIDTMRFWFNRGRMGRKSDINNQNENTQHLNVYKNTDIVGLNAHIISNLFSGIEDLQVRQQMAAQFNQNFQYEEAYDINPFLDVLPIQIKKQDLVDYFSIYFGAINEVKWNKGVGRRDKIRFAQLLAAIIIRQLILQHKLIHGFNADTLIESVATAAYNTGITSSLGEFDKDAVMNTVCAPFYGTEYYSYSGDQISDDAAQNIARNFSFVFTTNKENVSKMLDQLKGDEKEDKKVKKTKEFAKLYSEYRRGFVKFREKDLKSYWTKVDKAIEGFEIAYNGGNSELDLMADKGREKNTAIRSRQFSRLLFEFIHGNVKRVINTGVKAEFKLFKKIDNGENMAYAKEFYSKNFNEEGIEIDYSFQTMDEFIDFVGSLVSRYGSMEKSILKIFGKKNDDDDDDDDDDYGKWYKRDYLVYDNDGKNPKNCAPLFKEIKKFYKGLKKALENYKAEVAAKNLSDSEKRKKAKSLKNKNAEKLANIFKEILAITNKEAEYYKEYISKIGNAEAEKSIKEAIQVILEEVVKNNDIYDIKDVYRLVDWGEYGGSYRSSKLAGRLKIQAAIKQIKNAIRFANENSKEKPDDKVKEINERIVKEIIFNEALQLFLVKNCVKDFYSIGLFELINEERYDYDKDGRGIVEEKLKIKIDKTKTPAENLRLILDEFLEKSSEPKTIGGIYLDLKDEKEVISKIKDLMGKVYGKLEEAVSEDKEDEEEADDEETEAETDAETEDENEKKAGEEEEADMPIPPKEKEEIVNAIKNSAFFETALYGQNNVALNCGRMKYSVGPDGHPHIELTGIPGVGEREVVCIAILNEKDVVTPYYYMNKVGGDKLSATIPLDVAQNAIAFHFYIQDPAQPDLFKGPFVGAMNGINPSVLRSRIDNATFKQAKAFVRPGEKKGIESKMWTIDMGNLMAVYVKGGNIEDLSTKVAIMCGQNALPPDFGTRNRYIFQKMSNGDFIVVIGGELRELVRNKFSVHIYNDNGEPGNFQYYIQAVSDANSEKPGENEKAENKENKENESKDDKLLKQIEDEEDTDDKAQEDKTDEKPKAKTKKKMKGKKYKDEDDNEEGKDKNDNKGKKKKGEKNKKDKKAKDDKEKDDNGLHLLQNLNDKKPNDDIFGDFGI